MDDFENYSIDIDGYCLSNDFDDYDLYGEIMEGDNDNYNNEYDNIKFE